MSRNRVGIFCSIVAGATFLATGLTGTLVGAPADAPPPAAATKPAPATRATKPADATISFRNDVMPVFMAAGCNAGSCHGSARGQDGFRLSLFGYDADGDHFRLTREMPTRRINLARPEDSLLLLKASGAVSHGGGEAIAKDSPRYRTLLQWIEAGAPNDPPTVRSPVALEIEPKQMELASPGGVKQVRAVAKYSDGTERDVTSLALFQSSNDHAAEVSPDGVVTAKNRGEAFVMARFATFAVGSQAIVIPKDSSFQWPPVPEANYVDELVNRKLRTLKVQPSDLSDDATFARRAYIDLTGQLPTSADVREFVDSPDPRKRDRLVDDLVNGQAFSDLWVMKWAELLKIRSGDNANGVSYKATLLYYEWLRDRIAKNEPMNKIVHDLLSATGGTFDQPATNYYHVETDAMKVAENTAQVFVGMRLQCAQCHNHPFDRWTMDDYYGWTSFFSQVGRKPGEDPRETVIFNRAGGEVNNPVTKKPVPPKFLGDDTPAPKGRDRREVLADWLTAPENPYFARNMANIVWAHFFGQGIVEPVDDVRVSNPPSNPELLDELARRLVAYDFDVKRLVRDICSSRTYQLSSAVNPTNRDDQRNFSHAAVRRIRAEVLLDCISQVTESGEKYKGLPPGARAVHIADGRTANYFLTTFGRATRETVCSCEVQMEPNLSQALHLLNGDTVSKKIQSGGVVKRLLKEKRTPDQVVDELYLRCLSRSPTPAELAKLSEAISAAGPDREAALNDVFWALLNSKEFIFNH
jgi:hypothetical protein